MMERIKDRLWQLRQRFSAAARGRREKGAESAPIKGNIQNVIVVKPQNKIFSQVFFVLSDDYMRQNRLSSQELLRQAREAAGEYGGAMMPSTRRWDWRKAVAAILAAAVFLFGAYYFIFM